jgi:hypothetical protein
MSQCGEFGFVLFGAAQAGGLMTAERVALASRLALPDYRRLSRRHR